MKKVASGILPIIPIDRNARQALHKQIYDAYRKAIVDGSLGPGQRIPSTRVLASELGVSRFPVLNAYAQLLAEGYLESRVGAGTVVSKSLPEQFTSSKPARMRLTSNRSAPRMVSRHTSRLPRLERSPWLRGWGAFGVGQVAFDHFPIHILSNLVTRRCRNMDAKSVHYGSRWAPRLCAKLSPAI